MWREGDILSFLGTPLVHEDRPQFWSQGFCLPAEQCNEHPGRVSELMCFSFGGSKLNIIPTISDITKHEQIDGEIRFLLKFIVLRLSHIPRLPRNLKKPQSRHPRQGRCDNLRGVCDCVGGHNLDDCSGCRPGFAEGPEGRGCQACAADHRGVTCFFDAPANTG